MSKIQFKHWDDFLLTSVSKIGLYTGMVGTLVAAGMPLSFSLLSLVPDTLKQLYVRMPWHEKRLSLAYEKDMEEQERQGILMKAPKGDYLRNLLEGLCKRADVDPSTIDIYYTNGLRVPFFTHGRKIFCSRQIVHGFLEFDSEKLIKNFVAHELSHIITGDTKLSNRDKSFLADYGAKAISSRGTLLYATGILFMLTPEIPVYSLAAICAFPFYQRTVNLFHQRLQEYRADRNALSLTEDIDSAKILAGLSDSYEGYPPKNRLNLRDVWRSLNATHPKGTVRFSPLRRHFNAMMQKKAQASRKAEPKPRVS